MSLEQPLEEYFNGQVSNERRKELEAMFDGYIKQVMGVDVYLGFLQQREAKLTVKWLHLKAILHHIEFHLKALPQEERYRRLGLLKGALASEISAFLNCPNLLLSLFVRCVAGVMGHYEEFNELERAMEELLTMPCLPSGNPGCYFLSLLFAHFEPLQLHPIRRLLAKSAMQIIEPYWEVHRTDPGIFLDLLHHTVGWCDVDAWIQSGLCAYIVQTMQHSEYQGKALSVVVEMLVRVTRLVSLDAHVHILVQGLVQSLESEQLDWDRLDVVLHWLLLRYPKDIFPLLLGYMKRLSMMPICGGFDRSIDTLTEIVELAMDSQGEMQQLPLEIGKMTLLKLFLLDDQNREHSSLIEAFGLHRDGIKDKKHVQGWIEYTSRCMGLIEAVAEIHAEYMLDIVLALMEQMPPGDHGYRLIDCSTLIALSGALASSLVYCEGYLLEKAYRLLQATLQLSLTLEGYLAQYGPEIQLAMEQMTYSLFSWCSFYANHTIPTQMGNPYLITFRVAFFIISRAVNSEEERERAEKVVNQFLHRVAISSSDPSMLAAMEEMGLWSGSILDELPRQLPASLKGSILACGSISQILPPRGETSLPEQVWRVRSQGFQYMVALLAQGIDPGKGEGMVEGVMVMCGYMNQVLKAQRAAGSVQSKAIVIVPASVLMDVIPGVIEQYYAHEGVMEGIYSLLVTVFRTSLLDIGMRRAVLIVTTLFECLSRHASSMIGRSTSIFLQLVRCIICERGSKFRSMLGSVIEVLSNPDMEVIVRKEAELKGLYLQALKDLIDIHHSFFARSQEGQQVLRRAFMAICQPVFDGSDDESARESLLLIADLLEKVPLFESCPLDDVRERLFQSLQSALASPEAVTRHELANAILAQCAARR